MLDELVVALRNPVGRSIARSRMRSTISTALLKLVFMQHGDRCANVVAEIGDIMTIIGMALDKDPLVDRSDPRNRIIAGAVSACADMVALNRFDSRQLAAVEHGAKMALESISRLQPAVLLASAVAFQQATGRVVDSTLRGRK